jgi:CysZ protein
MIQLSKSFAAIFYSIFHHHKGLGRYLLISSGMSAVLLTLLAWGGWRAFEIVGTWLAEILPGSWKYEGIVFRSIGFLSSFVLLLLVFKYIVLILLGPALSTVSNNAESQGFNTNKSIGFVHSLVRALRINARYFFAEMTLTLLLFMMTLIPFISILTVVLMYLVQSYYAGRGVSDFYLEKYKTYDETLLITSKHKWACISMGSVFMILFVIPFFGVLIAPYLITIASTKYFEKEIRSV